MRLLTYDELPEEAAASSALTQFSAFGRPWRNGEIDLYRRSGALAPFVGVFAVEGRQVIGQTYCFRYTYRFPSGEAPVGGVAAVATRPDRTGRGVAHRILEEVHRREREGGVDHILLWTNRSWSAHRLYERLGYRDIYHPLLALRAFGPDAPAPIRHRVRRARVADVASMEELHAAATRRRWGFGARRPGTLALEVRSEGVKMLQQFWVAVRGRRLEGYAALTENRGRVECGELVARTNAAENALLRQHARRARKRWGVLDYSVASDRRSLLRRERYTLTDQAWFVLMGARTDGRAVSTRRQCATFGTDDSRFVCYLGDRF